MEVQHLIMIGCSIVETELRNILETGELEKCCNYSKWSFPFPQKVEIKEGKPIVRRVQKEVRKKLESESLV